MGLDMYLNARVSVSGFEFDSPEQRKVYSGVMNAVGLDKLESEDFPFATVEVCVIYWRKANAIHNWFVENVQDNNDDCGSYYVSVEKLTELRDACISVVERKVAPEDVLPPTQGFFFGSTETDEWYFESLKRTIEQIDRVFSVLPENADLYYHSSW